MRPSACALVLVCALAGCGAREDLQDAFAHALRDVRVVKNLSYSGPIVLGQIREDVPYGFARSLPWEGRWVPFVAQLDDNGVRWIREMRDPPIVARAWGGLSLGTRTSDGESFVRSGVPRMQAPCRWPGHWHLGCDD